MSALFVSCLLAVLAAQGETLAQSGVGGLNVRCDLKAEIEALVMAGTIEPLPIPSFQRDWQGVSQPQPGQPYIEDLPELAEPNDPESAPRDEIGGELKQKVVLLLKELVSIIESKEETGFRHLLTVTLAADRTEGFDSVWQSQVLTYVCRRYGLTIANLPEVLSQFERDEEVQTLLRSYSLAMEQLRAELSTRHSGAT